MDLTPKTKIDDLLKAYPFLLDFLINKSNEFKKLKNPIMRKTMGKIATLSKVATMGKFDLDPFMNEIADEIKAKANESVNIMKEVAAKIEPLTDPTARQETLKGIIRDLHKGVDMENLKSRFWELIQDVSPSEIANMEQKLIAEGLPESEVKRLCDVHVAVFKEALEKQEIPGAPPGHPVHTFMKENRASEEIMNSIEEMLNGIGSPPDEQSFSDNQGELTKLSDELWKVDIHFKRKENQLFPLLEAHDISGPSQVMWAIHDDIRASLKEVRKALSENNAKDSTVTLSDALSAIREMIYKEENILYPMSLETLSDADWIRVKEGEEEIGFAWVEPDEGWSPKPEAEEVSAVGPEKMSLDTGYLSKEHINLMLTNLPVDITLVDEEDRVSYYSKGEERIFPRSPGIIGRKVQRCHPPDSVHMVNKILDTFKAGERDAAEFWITLGDKFILIRYYALRDKDANYKGCLEVSQDVTEIRQLKGQRRLLDWE